ncbi:MAG: hypothetical protein IKJ74_05375 [Clostridia bacterium]|nr:hypothetical protein [Clostridia bacterium]
MKTFIKITSYVLLVAVCVTLFICETRACAKGPYLTSTKELEFLFYGNFCALALLTFGYVFWDRFSLKMKLLGAGITSILYTAAVFFANNFWRCLNDNFYFGDRFFVPYKAFLLWDITYTTGYGEFRYPLVFAAMLILCGVVIVFTLPRIKEAVGRLRERISRWGYFGLLRLESLEDLYGEYRWNVAKERLSDYVSQMPLTKKSKERLKSYAIENEDGLLIYLFIKRYEKMLTKEEFEFLRQLFVKEQEECIQSQRETYSTATVANPEVFERLEERFRETGKA